MLLSQDAEKCVLNIDAASLGTDMLIACSEQEEMINRIYQTYKKLMLYAAYQILENQKDAQNAAYSIKRHQIRHGGLDTSLDELREKAGDVVPEEHSFLEQLTLKERYQEVVEAIRGLPELYREVLFLCYVEEYSISAIAKRLGRKEDTVRQQLSRGRKMLIKRLNEKEDA